MKKVKVAPKKVEEVTAVQITKEEFRDICADVQSDVICDNPSFSADPIKFVIFAVKVYRALEDALFNDDNDDEESEEE